MARTQRTKPDPVPSPTDESGLRALKQATQRWGPSARVVESPELDERISGKKYQVGVLREVRRVKRGFRPTDSTVFVALGRGDTWALAFEDADRFNRDLSAAMGPRAVEDLNRETAKHAARRPKPVVIRGL